MLALGLAILTGLDKRFEAFASTSRRRGSPT